MNQHNTKHLVCYHSPCMDGSAAAVAHEHAYGKGCTYLGINYGHADSKEVFKAHLINNLGEDFVFDVIWFLDFCPKVGVLDYLKNIDKHVIIIDHHKTAISTIDTIDSNITLGHLTYVLCKDNELSGAALTRILHNLIPSIEQHYMVEPRNYVIQVGNITTSLLSNLDFDIDDFKKKLDPVYELIRVRDVWDERNPLLKSRADAFYQYLTFSGGFDPEKLKGLNIITDSVSDNNPMDAMIEKGELIGEVLRIQCKNALGLGYKVKIDAKGLSNINVFIGSVPYKLDSTTGDIWSKMHPDEPAIMVGLTYNHDKNGVGVSLRSNAHIDCLTLAQCLGGGGHPKASGGRLGDTLNDVSHSPSFINKYIINLIKEIY